MNDAERIRAHLRTAERPARGDAEHHDGRNSDRPATSYHFAPLADFAAHHFPQAEPLLGEPGTVYLAVGSLLLCYGAEGAGKTTWTIDGIAHLAAGEKWLGISVARPVRFLVIENEGPPALFQAKLEAKRQGWQGQAFAENVHVFKSPWGEFTFEAPEARAALAAYCEEHEIDVVAANPTLGLGVAASGRPDETQRFMDWLRECGLGADRAFWLLHHRNKAAQVSGDWGRHPDTLALLEPDGARQRTKLTWEKTRWATLGADEHPRSLMLEWEVETEGYSVTALDTVGASDAELVERLVAFLSEHPAASTRQIRDEVEGSNERLRRLLEERPEFDCADGPRGAKCWMVAPTGSGGGQP